VSCGILFRLIAFLAATVRIIKPGLLSRLAISCLAGLAACTQPAPLEIQKPVETISASTVTVQRGQFRHVIRLHGTVEAVQSYGVMAPRLAGGPMSTMIITKVVRNGTRVRKGDILVEFDRQNQMKNVLDRQAEYDNLVAQIKRKEADQATARAVDETELKGAEVDLQSALVDMRKNEVVPSIQAEINKQNLAEAQARLKQLKDTLALKREAAAAELRILEIQRDRAKNAAEYAQGNIEKMTIQSPLDGLVVLSPVNKGSRMVDPSEGDEVRPGGGIMQVVNPAAMQVRARVNQVDIANVRIGQETDVRLDAYPDLLFQGKIDRISAVAAAGSYSKQVRYFVAVISIQGSDPKLMPDLTAAVDVKLETLENVLLVPREAIAMEKDQAFVEVIMDGRTEYRAVKTGPMNECETVIESGLQEGTVVARNPRIKADSARSQPGQTGAGNL